MKYNLQNPEAALTVLAKNKANEWEVVQHETFSDSELWKEYVCLRTKFSLKFSVENASSYLEQMQLLLNNAKAKLLESNKPTLKIENTEILLKQNKGLAGIGKNGKVSAALLQTKKGESPKTEESQLEVMNIILASGDNDSPIDDISSAFSSKTNKNNLSNSLFIVNKVDFFYRCWTERVEKVNSN